MEDLPPGIRFYPTEEELVAFYLHNKLEGQRNDMNRVIPVVGLYDLEPWQLPKLAGELCREDTEQWFFFSPRQERETRGGRPNRTTAWGYWKATGSPGYVYSSDNRVIGVKKTMVFYKGKAPSGRKTKWKMNEYRAIEVSDQSSVATPKVFCGGKCSSMWIPCPLLAILICVHCSTPRSSTKASTYDLGYSDDGLSHSCCFICSCH